MFAYLEPKEAATFRWAGRVVAEIGLHYLTPKIHLRLREESYDRLLAISEHPVASKCVVELEYETEGLWLIDRKRFDRIFMLTKSRSRRRTSSREVFSRNFSLPGKKSTLRETTQLLDRAWSLYKEYQAGYEKVKQAAFFFLKMVKAFKRLPALKTISTPAASAYERYVAEVKDLLPTYSFVDVDYHKVPSCISATTCVLLAAESAGLQLSEFHCPRFNWQTLTRDVIHLPSLNRSIFHLKVLNIALVEPRHMCQKGSDVGIDNSSLRCPKNGQVFSFITSAPGLERLELKFDTKYYCLLSAKEIMKDFHWPFLKAISLDRLSTNEQYLVQFFERHKHTLREIHLGDLCMPRGLWLETFQQMRRIFKFGHQLDICTLGGTFRDCSHVPFEMESISDGNIYATGTIISDYIRATNFGDITLTDYWEIIQSNNYLNYVLAGQSD